MTTLEQVRSMKAQGLSEQEIIQNLQEKGIAYREISEALSQSKIKAAVEEPIGEPTPPSPQEQFEQPQYSQEMSGMQKSMMQSPDEAPVQVPMQEYQPQETYAQDYAYPQQQYEGYVGGAGISSETITEISEQVVAERMADMRKHLNKVIDFKTSIESKTESIEDRLKRIEKIIDVLQSSVLKKVGDYVNNVDDIKRELIETQKSFSKIIPSLSKHHSQSEHSHQSRSQHHEHKKHKK